VRDYVCGSDPFGSHAYDAGRRAIGRHAETRRDSAPAIRVLIHSALEPGALEEMYKHTHRTLTKMRNPSLDPRTTNRGGIMMCSGGGGVLASIIEPATRPLLPE